LGKVIFGFSLNLFILERRIIYGTIPEEMDMLMEFMALRRDMLRVYHLDPFFILEFEG
jgi:hypothetical protein